MKILGIDYGRRKIGLAISEGVLSQPWKVLRVNNFEDAVEKVLQVLQVLQVEKVIVGISEGEMGEESKKFAKVISHKLSVVIDTFDETLSTYHAQRLSMEAGIGRKKRRKMEDAYAATVMLQNCLDTLH